MSIFARFGVMSNKLKMHFSIEFVWWLAKNANHNISTMAKQVFGLKIIPNYRGGLKVQGLVRPIN